VDFFSSGSSGRRDRLWSVRSHLLWPAVAVWVGAVGLVVPSAQSVPPRAAAPASRPDVTLFAHSEDCQACHNNLTAPNGEDVSIGVAWRATMMANSARDPYFQAAVRRETLDHPSHAGAIQDECGGCHMPMSTHIARAQVGAGAQKGEVFARLPIAGADGEPIDRLAADGVSCTVCHQIAPDGLGTRARFNGHFAVTAPLRDGVRQIYGPYEIDAGRKTIMRSVTGYEQVKAPHIQESELCASCHSLFTDAIGPDGRVIGSLAEQMNYQEWRHSAYPDEKRSCQSCHMPRAEGPLRVASVLGESRETLSRHVFIGGNAHMLRILNRYRAELGVSAASSELEATAVATIRQLQHDTAEVSVSPARVSGQSPAGQTLSFDVDVRNLTGHKYPTGYPSRRTWLHVVVRDADGRAVFESGAPRPDGSIEGNDADRDAQTFEPHYDLVTNPTQVQIYEPVLGDVSGAPTTGLLTATQYLKDNRLLPRGFDKSTAPPEVAVAGTARTDATFAGGGDRVRYEVPVSGSGPFTVAVELLYQSIGYRWAHNLERYDAVEPKRFVGYYNDTAAGSAIPVARAAARTEPPR
jgi:hypothetical protein